MVVTIADISADTGEVYDAIDGGTTAVKSIISRAESFVKLFTTTTTGFDTITRPIADAMVTNQVVGGIDSVNKTIGTLSVGDKDLKDMKLAFQKEANKAAIHLGYSVDGLQILFRDSEQ